MNDLNGATVLVTGANRGIGRATAERFLETGARVIATARDTSADGLKELESGSNGRLTVERCDIARPDDVTSLLARVERRFGGLDVLVNNAGVLVEEDRNMTADALEPEVLQRTLDVNLFGTIAMCRAFAPLLRDGGRIVNVSSTMGQLDDGLGATTVAYSVSKAALNAYTSALAAALGAREILVDAIHPGWVKTEMGGAGAHVEPREATETILYLATRPPGDTGKFWYRSRVIAW